VNYEIERKFLIDTLPEGIFEGVSLQVISQGYLFIEGKNELRVRKIGDEHLLTQKMGSGLVREETEEPISQNIFNILWPFTQSKRVEKKRYRVIINNQACDIDVYTGALDGLTVLEAEFPNEAAAHQFSPPPFCIREITTDHHFKNSQLATLEKT